MLNNEVAVVNRFELWDTQKWEMGENTPFAKQCRSKERDWRSGHDNTFTVYGRGRNYLVCSPWHQTQPFLSISDLYNRLSSSSAEDIENLVYKYLREDVDYPKHMLFTLASKIAQYITYKVIWWPIIDLFETYLQWGSE